MKLTTVSGRHFVGLVSLVAPLLVFAIAKIVGLGPLMTHAQSEPNTNDSDVEAPARQVDPPTLEARLQPPAESTASLARTQELRVQPAGEFVSPFYQAIAIEEPPEQQVAPVETPPPPAPTFALSGVMNSRPPIAVIDGDVHRVGDDLANGWRIQSIDAKTLAVTLRHADGREYRLTTGKP